MFFRHINSIKYAFNYFQSRKKIEKTIILSVDNRSPWTIVHKPTRPKTLHHNAVVGFFSTTLKTKQDIHIHLNQISKLHYDAIHLLIISIFVKTEIKILLIIFIKFLICN